MEIVRLLVNQAANLEHQNSMGNTPLLSAARNGHWDTVSLLLKHGAIIEQQDHEGRTPLDYALVLDGRGHDFVYLLVQAAGQQGYISLLTRTLYLDRNQRLKRRRVGEFEMGD